MIKLRNFIGMESTVNPNTNTSEFSTEYPSTTETAEKIKLADYLLTHYIIIIVPSVFICVFLIIMFILLIRKIMNRHRFDLKQLDTYSSVNYDDEMIDDDLEGSENLMYTSCRLLVGPGYEENNIEVTNSEPEYDCMSVDVSVSAKESAIVDWRTNDNSLETSQEVSQNLKPLPHNFWKR